MNVPGHARQRGDPMLARSSTALCAACLAACAAAPRGPAPAGSGAPRQAPHYALRATPPSLQAAASRADRAIAEFKHRVTRELMVELARRGPAAAVEALRAGDPFIAADVRQETGCEVGRTSPRLRSPRNAPPAWLGPLLGNGEARPAAGVEPLVVDLGDRVGVVRPIAVYAACLDCHGPEVRLQPRVRAALATAYPADRATGYAEGDLRGFYWAEARKERVR